MILDFWLPAGSKTTFGLLNKVLTCLAVYSPSSAMKRRAVRMSRGEGKVKSFYSVYSPAKVETTSSAVRGGFWPQSIVDKVQDGSRDDLNL